MKSEEIIERCGEIIADYNSEKMLTPERLLQMQRGLIDAQFELTKINVESFSKWNEMIYKRGDKSVNAAETDAHHYHPELRQSRKFLEVIKSTLIAIQSELKNN